MKQDTANAPRGVSKCSAAGAKGSQNQGKRKSGRLVKNPAFPSQPPRDTETIVSPAEKKQVAKLQIEQQGQETAGRELMI